MERSDLLVSADHDVNAPKSQLPSDDRKLLAEAYIRQAEMRQRLLELPSTDVKPAHISTPRPRSMLNDYFAAATTASNTSGL